MFSRWSTTREKTGTPRPNSRQTPTTKIAPSTLEKGGIEGGTVSSPGTSTRPGRTLVPVLVVVTAWGLGTSSTRRISTFNPPATRPFET